MGQPGLLWVSQPRTEAPHTAITPSEHAPYRRLSKIASSTHHRRLSLLLPTRLTHGPSGAFVLPMHVHIVPYCHPLPWQYIYPESLSSNCNYSVKLRIKNVLTKAEADGEESVTRFYDRFGVFYYEISFAFCKILGLYVWSSWLHHDLYIIIWSCSTFGKYRYCYNSCTKWKLTHLHEAFETARVSPPLSVWQGRYSSSRLLIYFVYPPSYL